MGLISGWVPLQPVNLRWAHLIFLLIWRMGCVAGMDLRIGLMPFLLCRANTEHVGGEIVTIPFSASRKQEMCVLWYYMGCLPRR